MAFALASHPDRIGVGRLCQELLADVTGERLAVNACNQVSFPQTGPKPGMPRPRAAWSAERRAKYQETIMRKRGVSL